MNLEQRFQQIILEDTLCRAALIAARNCRLPQAALVAGALYQTVWNALTGRPSGYGVEDVDIVYFDGSDLSYAAEDAAIRSAAPFFSTVDFPVQIRNQARVHLWFEEKFGAPYPPLASVEEGVWRYTSRTHAILARLRDDDQLEVFAPFGLEDLFALRLAPNHTLDNRASYEAKAARAKARWPELTIEPW